MTTWIRFMVEVENENGSIIGVDMVEKAFNSQMTDVFQGSDFNQTVNGMFTHMKTQIENPALENSRLRFDDVLFMDINFYQLNLTQGSSYIPLPDWVSRKSRVINPNNESDKEYFKWAVIAALYHVDIKSHPERISNLLRFDDNYDWSELGFPSPIKGISEFEKKNDAIVNVLGAEEKKFYILRGRKYDYRKKVVNLLPIADRERRHCTAIKSLSRFSEVVIVSMNTNSIFA